MSRILLKRRIVLWGVVVGVMLASLLTAPPAQAIGIWVHRECDQVYAQNSPDPMKADFCVGFDYSGSDNGNRIRAYARAVTWISINNNGWQRVNTPVTIIYINLGTGNGVLDTAGGYANDGDITVDTTKSISCHTQPGAYYNAHAAFQVDFPGGASTWNFYTYHWYSDNHNDSACFNQVRTFNWVPGGPNEPSYVNANFG